MRTPSVAAILARAPRWGVLDYDRAIGPVIPGVMLYHDGGLDEPEGNVIVAVATAVLGAPRLTDGEQN